MFNIYTDDFMEGWADMVYRIAHCSGAKFESTGRGNTLAKGTNGVVTLHGDAIESAVANVTPDSHGELLAVTFTELHPLNPQRNRLALSDYVMSLIKGTPQYEQSRENVYAYGIRLHEYTLDDSNDIDQIKDMCDKIRDNPYRRDIQAITWIPYIDGRSDVESPPCLQRIAVRQMSDDGGCRLRIDFRSNDTKAFIFNIIAIATMVDYEVMKPNGKYIKEIFYTSDNTHIYEDDWDTWAKFVRPARIS